MVTIRYLTDGFGHTFILPGGEAGTTVTLGRNSAVDVCLYDKDKPYSPRFVPSWVRDPKKYIEEQICSMSREHARLTYGSGDTDIIECLGRNGIIFSDGGKRLEKGQSAELHNGDRVYFGSAEFTYHRRAQD